MTIVYIKIFIACILFITWIILIYFPRENSEKLISFIQLSLSGLAGNLLSPT